MRRIPDGCPPEKDLDIYPDCYGEYDGCMKEPSEPCPYLKQRRGDH